MTMTMTMTMIDNDNDFYFFNGPFWGMEEIQLNGTYIMFNNDIHLNTHRKSLKTRKSLAANNKQMKASLRI